jgi:hypothetical protein
MRRMHSSEQISALVRQVIAAYRHGPSNEGSTIGTPWPEDRIRLHIAILQQALVTPYRQAFSLRETYGQSQAKKAETAEYWVIAELDGMLEWYDEATGDFGLGQRIAGQDCVSIGVRGDLIGVFCAR